MRKKDSALTAGCQTMKTTWEVYKKKEGHDRTTHTFTYIIIGYGDL